MQTGTGVAVVVIVFVLLVIVIGFATRSPRLPSDVQAELNRVLEHIRQLEDTLAEQSNAVTRQRLRAQLDVLHAKRRAIEGQQTMPESSSIR